MIETSIYRLTPTAPRNDPNWGRATCHGDVVVRARGSGEARAIAAQAAGASSKITTQVVASAFRDPVLYGVRMEDGGAFPAEGPRGVLEGSFGNRPVYVTTHDD